MNRILLENSNNRHLIQIRTTVPERHASAYRSAVRVIP
jgi:hypothetical protein